MYVYIYIYTMYIVCYILYILYILDMGIIVDIDSIQNIIKSAKLWKTRDEERGNMKNIDKEEREDKM